MVCPEQTKSDETGPDTTFQGLADWLRWQESLHPQEIDLGLGRVRDVASRLPIDPPPGRVFTVAGTNGKGSTAACLERLLIAGGYRVGTYTSPHLVRYNERICVSGQPVADAALIEAFERIECARGSIPLTFFEYGTLAALLLFSSEGCDAWVLEVGLGGRLDAVNVVDPDFSLITTIALDHEAWLGDSVEQIAAEKAGIMRADAPAFYGDAPPPEAILRRADELGTRLYRCGHDYEIERDAATWTWTGERVRLENLPAGAHADDAQLRNIALALAAVEQLDANLLRPESIAGICEEGSPAGRFQLVDRKPQWVLDVAHNVQAARRLRKRLETLRSSRHATMVVGMLADKPVESFAHELAGIAGRWIVAPLDGARVADERAITQSIAAATGQPVECADGPATAFVRAEGSTPPDGLVVCCGSFRIVGPALEWLGLYS